MNPENRQSERDARLLKVIGDKPITVYFEATPLDSPHNNLDRSELGHNHLIITHEHFKKQDPEALDENGNHTATHINFVRLGEKYSKLEEINIIVAQRECSGQENDSYEVARNKCLDILKDIVLESERNVSPAGNMNVLINPRYLVKLPGNQSTWQSPHSQSNTYEDFIKELGLVGLPTRVNLGEMGTYTIISQPQYGSVTLVDNILVYTPNENFGGRDQLDFIFNGEVGRIIFDIN